MALRAISLIGAGSSSSGVSALTTGTVTLSGGTATVSYSGVTAASKILVTSQALGTVSVPQPLGVTSRVVGTSFTITSATPTDTSTVAYAVFA